LIKAHPYEEVAYEFMPIEIPRFKKGLWSGIGYGVWGEAAQPIELEELLSRARKTFGVSQIRVSGTPRPVKKIAFCAGKATSFVATATSLDIDAFIVGEVDYHSALSRTRAGQLTLELGHTESERFFPEVILGWLGAL
jgi:putative NIF3 family GTP cyclohydrolase 1 type 2